MREPFKDFMKKELGPETVLIACGLPASYKTETTEKSLYKIKYSGNSCTIPGVPLGD